jgi:hypothetical protein
MKKFILLFIILFNSSELFGSYFCNNIREILKLNKRKLRLFNFNHYYYFKNYYSSWTPKIYFKNYNSSWVPKKFDRSNNHANYNQLKNIKIFDYNNLNQTISSQLSESSSSQLSKSSKKIEENFIRILNEKNTIVVLNRKILGHDEPVVLNLKQNCNLEDFVVFPNN